MDGAPRRRPVGTWQGGQISKQKQEGKKGQWRWADIAVRISLHTGPELGRPSWSRGWSGWGMVSQYGGSGN